MVSAYLQRLMQEGLKVRGPFLWVNAMGQALKCGCPNQIGRPRREKGQPQGVAPTNHVEPTGSGRAMSLADTLRGKWKQIKGQAKNVTVHEMLGNGTVSGTNGMKISHKCL